MAKPFNLDVLSLVKSGLRESERLQSGGSGDPYIDAISESIKYADENRKRNDIKNAQMQKMMDLQVEGYQSNFTTQDIQKKYNRLDSYISKNRGRMDDITLEYADVLKQNIGDHREKVVKFSEDVDMFEATKDDWMQKADDYFARGESLNDQDYDDISGSIEDYVRMKNEIIENNADFLGLPQFKHVLNSMTGQEAVINDLLEEAKDQQVFTEYEHNYLTKALQTGNYKIIDDERAKKKTLTGEYMKNQVADIAPVYDKHELYKLLDQGKSATVPSGMMIMGNTEAILNPSQWADDEEQLELFEKEFEDSEDNLNRLNSIYETNTGDNYIIARGGTPTKFEWASKKRELFKDHFGLDDDEINNLSEKAGEKLMDEYSEDTGLDPDTGKEIKDVDSKSPNIGTIAGASYFIGRATGANEKIAAASKFALEETKKGYRYVHHVAKNIPLEDINILMKDEVVQNALDDLDALKTNMDDLSDQPHSKDYKKAKRAYDAKAKQHAKALRGEGRIKTPGSGPGKKVTSVIKNINETELTKLLKNPNKWNTMKLKRHLWQTIPGLAKGWRSFVPGGGFASFELGRRAAKEFAEKFVGEGLGAEVTGVAVGAATHKYIYSRAKKKIAAKLATPAGKKWLVKKLGTVIGKRMASSTITGLAAGGGTPASIATGVIGAVAGIGMAALDIKDLFFSEEEEE